jgi:ABC-type transport system involved in multi-copper enzyme maturation permease subunit
MTTTLEPDLDAHRDIDARLEAVERRTAHMAEVIDTHLAGRPAGHRGARREPVRQGVTFAGVLTSEWIKLRSVRSSTWTLLATGGTMLLLGALAAALNGGLLTTPEDLGEGPDVTDPTGTVLFGSMIAALIVGVLGVVLMTSEYATGLIRTTMTLVPKRLPVLWAKVTVLTAVTLPVMVVTSLVTFLTGQLLLGAGDAATASLGDDGVLRAVLGTGVYLAGVAVMGLAAGTLLRSTASAISALVGLLFLLPVLGRVLLPSGWQDDVLPYLPSNAGASFTTVAPGADLLGTGAGALVFAAWVVVPVVGAALALKRRPV